LGICILKSHHSKKDLDYMIPKRNKPNVASNSQIYILEKEVTNSGSVFVVKLEIAISFIRILL
jgi:hypothetical protein